MTQTQGYRRVDTRYTGPERRIPLDSDLLTVVLVAMCGFWGVVGWAVWEWLK